MGGSWLTSPEEAVTSLKTLMASPWISHLGISSSLMSDEAAEPVVASFLPRHSSQYGSKGSYLMSGA